MTHFYKSKTFVEKFITFITLLYIYIIQLNFNWILNFALHVSFNF